MNAYEIARVEATRVVEAAYRKAVAAGELPEGTIPPVAVEAPKDSSNGDWASTFAMQCAKPLHMAPRKIAESIVANLDLEGSCFDTVTIAGPGFMNFTLNQGWYEQAVRGVFAMGENYGRTESKKPEKVMVEFVSANPTGPMHMGNARGGVLGDCLSSVLDWSGNDVTREFYINDAGNQVDKFAHSVEGRYIQEIRGEDAIEFDASWYQGDDIKALAHDLVEIDAGDTYAYDEEGAKTKDERERKAADRIFGLLPEDQGMYLKALWEEFEAYETAEAKYAHMLDNFQPLLLNDAAGGISWTEHQVKKSQIYKRNEKVEETSVTIWKCMQNKIDKHIQAGHVLDE